MALFSEYFSLLFTLLPAFSMCWLFHYSIREVTLILQKVQSCTSAVYKKKILPCLLLGPDKESLFDQTLVRLFCFCFFVFKDIFDVDHF